MSNLAAQLVPPCLDETKFTLTLTQLNEWAINRHRNSQETVRVASFLSPAPGKLLRADQSSAQTHTRSTRPCAATYFPFSNRKKEIESTHSQRVMGTGTGNGRSSRMTVASVTIPIVFRTYSIHRFIDMWNEKKIFLTMNGIVEK